MAIVNLSNFPQFTAINVLSDPGNVGGPIIIPQATQVILTWTLTDGKVAHNIMYGSYTGAFALTVAQANTFLATLSSGSPWTTLAGFLAATAALTQVSFRNVAIRDQPLINGDVTAHAGTSIGTALPDETAAVITLRTPKAGRANRGRVYVPGWASNAVGTGGVIAPAAVTALQTWANSNLAPAFSGAGLGHVIGQKERAAYTGSTGTMHPHRDATTTPVTSYPVRDNHWDSMRRRGLK